MLNVDVLARNPASYTLADGGIAKVAFPPGERTLPVLREQLETFVCEGAYANALRRTLEGFNAVCGGKTDTPAAWISGFYGSGKSLLAAMLGALWTNHTFKDGMTAEGLIQSLPADVRAPLQELRTKAKRLGTHLAVGGTTLGAGAGDPVKAVLGLLMRAAGLPATADLRPMLCALWLAEQGVLDSVRAELGAAFPDALEAFLLDDRVAAAAAAAKPALGDVDRIMDRLNAQYAVEPEATPDLLVDKGRQALKLQEGTIPLTLLILDEVQQFIREDPNRSLVIQIIAERLASDFDGRVLLVCTGQSALGDTPYLDRLLGRFPLRYPLGSADIQSVIRKTLLRKPTTMVPAVQAVLDGYSGEIDKHLQGTSFRRTEADRVDAAADWPLLSTRRRLWDRVLLDLDRSGLGGTLRSQLRVTMDALRKYGDRPITTAVPGDFLLDTFGAEALSRQLIGGEFFDKVETQRAQPGDGPLRGRILLLAYMLARIAGDVDVHGVRATTETFADLLIEDLSEAPALRSKVPVLLAGLADDGMLMDVGGEWRLQTKESAEWQATFNKTRVEEGTDLNAIARQRAEMLKDAIDNALTGALRVNQGASKTTRNIERVTGAAKTEAGGLVLRVWNEWEHGRAPLADIQAGDAAKDATINLFVPLHRSADLTDAIVTKRTAEQVLQRMGLPSSEGGREAKAAMEAKLANARKVSAEILREAVDKATVLLAGGVEVGPGDGRSQAVLAAAGRVLVRLYPDFDAGDNASWGTVVTRTKARAPDALKEVGHQADPHTHPVCKVILNALKTSKKGSELRTLFCSAPYGWPKEAVDGAVRVLALAGQVIAKGQDHKAVDLSAVTDQAFGTLTFQSEGRTVTVAEKMAVRGLGTALGLKIPSGEELQNLPIVIERLAAIATTAGGAAPAPAIPPVPGMEVFRSTTGNELLAELAGRADTLKSQIVQWHAAADLMQARMPQWTLAEELISLGATDHQDEAQAIRSQRSLLSEPDPVAPLVAGAAQGLVKEANSAHGAWKLAWEHGEARLSASQAWGKLASDKQTELRERHKLREWPAPDLSSPSMVVQALRTRNCDAWRDMAAAYPARVEAVLQEAAVESEPKTQVVSIPRPTLRDERDLSAWLETLREAITPLLGLGPVLPSP